MHNDAQQSIDGCGGSASLVGRLIQLWVDIGDLAPVHVLCPSLALILSFSSLGRCRPTFQRFHDGTAVSLDPEWDERR